MRQIKTIIRPVIEEFSKDKCGLCHSPADDFVRSQWQKNSKSLTYLIYRWIVGLFFIAVVIDSIIDNGYEDTSLYLIYLTNWGVLCCMLTHLLGAIIVTFWHFHDGYANNLMEMNSLTKTLKTYWGMHITTTILSIVITILYWSILYIPAETELSVTNLLTHAFNSIFMLLDLLIVAYPVRLLHVFMPILFGISFAIFSFIYHIFGGTNKKKEPYIYSILDWNQPEKVLTYLAGVLILTCFVYICVFAIYKLRICLHRRSSGSSVYLSTAENWPSTWSEVKSKKNCNSIGVNSTIAPYMESTSSGITMVFGKYSGYDNEGYSETVIRY